MRSSGGYLFATLATTAPTTAPQAGLRWRGPWASDPFLTGSGCMRSWAGAAVAAFWLARCVPPQRRRPHRPGTKHACEPSFELFCLAACWWPWSCLGISTGSVSALRSKLSSPPSQSRRLDAAAGRRHRAKGAAYGVTCCGRPAPATSFILVRGDAPPDRCARAAADARRPRSVPRPRPPRAGSPCRSPDRRFSWRGAPCRDHRSPAV